MKRKAIDGVVFHRNKFCVPISLGQMDIRRELETELGILAWTVEVAVRTTFSSSGSGGLSNTSTFTCIHLIPASLCAGACAIGFSITIIKGGIFPLTIEPRMKFIIAYLILLHRR